jgi:two-component system response regulator (stage 0 sporulation protein A)
MDSHINVLIADSNEDFCEQLKNALKQIDGCDAVAIANDGLQARELLQSLHPEVLVLDLTLSKLDGMSVLKLAAGMEKKPATVVTSSFVTEYVAAMTTNLGAQYFILKPCDCEAVAERIRELRDTRVLQQRSAFPGKQQNERSIETMVTIHPENRTP